MSKGLGTMQRAILAAVGDLSATPEAGQQTRTGGWCIRRRALQAAVRKRHGGGRGFGDSFSRALRGLIARGLLVGVPVWDGFIPTHPSMKVRWVRKP
jgi:hypothetical protein